MFQRLFPWPPLPPLPSPIPFSHALMHTQFVFILELHVYFLNFAPPPSPLSLFRERTLQVYSIYSRKPAPLVHSLLAGLGATHVVIEDVWCWKRYRPGCALHEVWDVVDPDNQDKPVFCESVKDHTPDQFKLVFLNKSYRILQLL